MRIVHCIFTMKMGGAQVLTVDILNQMCLLHDVDLIVINDDYNTNLLQQLDKKVSIHRLNRKEGSRNPWPIVHLNWLLNRLQPDIIHCHERKMIRLIKYSPAQTVYTIHDVTIPTDTFHQYDALVAISKSVAVDVRSRLNLPVDIVNNGIPMHKFARRKHYAAGSESLVRLVQISRLVHEKKGQDVLIQALAKLVHEHQATNVRLDFIGDGPSKQYLASLAESLKVGTFINFCGEQSRSQIAQNLSTYHILVQPSRFEGFGLTVVEGFAAGLPVVASDIDGPAEIMQNVPAGFLFVSENVDDCTNALRRAMNAYHRAQIETAVNQTYVSIEKRFSIQSTVENYLTIYRRLTANKHRQPLLRILPLQLRPTS